jgi:type I restriction enzyme M protein
VNTFKPHTGTKTSVLFLQKYTDEEKRKIQEIKAKYEVEFDEFLGKLRMKYKDIDWNTEIDEEELHDELKSFIETYFETRELLEEGASEAELEESDETEKILRKPLKSIVDEMQETQDLLREKEEELKEVSESKKGDLKKEIKTLTAKLKKLHRQILERTIGGQIYLVLNEEKITKQFKEFWLEGRVLKEIDYPIFFAVNQKPVKNNKGEYRYRKRPNGELLIDEKTGHPIIDHDLDEIAEAFVKFAKEQKLDFWKE